MSGKQLWEGNDSAEWITKITGKTKLIFLFVFSILTITIDNPRSLFFLFIISLSLHLLGKTSFSKWKVMIIILLLSLWGTMVSQAMFYSQTPRTPLFVLINPDSGILGQFTNGIYIYREGIVYGAVQGLRSVIMLSLGLLLCWTSDPRNLLQAMINWKLPLQLSFMIITAIRFLPVIASEAGEVLTALQLRSSEINAKTKIIMHIPHIAKPLLARCLRRAQVLAMSVVSRGFFSVSKANNRFIHPWREKVVCVIIIWITLIILVSKFIYFLLEHGIYIGAFRYIYDWAKLYL